MHDLMRLAAFVCSTVILMLGVFLSATTDGWLVLLIGFLMFCVTLLAPGKKEEPKNDGYEKWIEAVSELKEKESKETDPNFEEYLRLKSEGRLG